MKLLTTSMTVENPDGLHWLVSFAHDSKHGESIDLTVRVLKSEQLTMPELQRQAVERAIELLRILADKRS